MSNAAIQPTQTLAIGDKAPEFSLPNQSGETVTLADYAGKNLALYFYPKDDTSGCTTEAIDFTGLKGDFTASNTAILGVSKDSVAKHEKFIAKHELGVDLLSDEECVLCDAYGVWVEKSMYGKKYMGIERATYLIDGEGIIREIWRKVKVKDHAKKVLEAAQAL